MNKPLAALLALMLAPAAAAQTPPKPWRHGIVEAKNDVGFVMMPQQFAARQGLAIDYVQLKGDALVLKAFLAGELDSYEASPGGAMIAASRGADVKIIGCYFPGLMYGLFTQHDVNSLDDMKGRAFGISSPGSLPDLMVRAMLDEAHIPASAVRFAVMGSDADRFRALSAGVVAAAGISTEFMPLAAGANLKMLTSGKAALPNYVRFCTFVSGKTLRDRHDDVAALLAAQMQGERYALSHRDETVALTERIIHLKPDDPRPGFVFDQVAAGGLVDPAVPLPREKLQWMEELLVRTGNLAKPFDVSAMLDDSARAAAVARAGAL